VGHAAPTVEARYLAAVWACGDEAVLSGLPAGHLLGLLLGTAPDPEVSAPTERRVAGVLTQRRRTIGPRDRIAWNGVPVTSVPRTLVDLAAVLSAPELALACHRAGVIHRTTPAHVAAVLARSPNPPGHGSLISVLTGETPVSLSKLERRFLGRLRAARLPLPDQTNRYADEHRVDCRWISLRLTVELDSYRFHNSRWAFEQDRRRERAAYARGDQHRRYTWHDVIEDPTAMLAELAKLLPRPS